jgi:MFS transporter, DHA1 family, tetracycline resistance protein
MQNSFNPKARYFIFATVLIDAIGIGIIIPVLPNILNRFVNNAHDKSIYFGYFTAVFALVQFLAAPVLGNLSDAFGRRKVLLISLLGASIDYLLMAFAPNLFLLFVGRVVAGFTSATHSVAASCMADVSHAENRASNFGLIGAAFGMGFILGPAIGGMLGNLGDAAPFLAAAAFCFLNLIFGTFVLPETLSLENRRKFELSEMNPFKSLAKLFKILPQPFLFACFILLYLAGHVHPSNWTLYTTHKFGWSSFDVGLSLSFVGICIAFFQGFAVKFFVKKWGERKTILMGILVGSVGYALLSFAYTGWQAFALCLLFGFSGVAMPTLQSQFSKQVNASQQGALQGGLMAIGSICAMIGPIVYSHLFGFFSERNHSKESIEGFFDRFNALYFPGAAYFCAAIFCWLAALFYLKAQKQNQNG